MYLDEDVSHIARKIIKQSRIQSSDNSGNDA
jgi:hypothetical protein